MSTILLLSSSDVTIFTLMAVTLAATVLLILRARLLFVRVGGGLSCGTAWLGLAYFGVKPLFGGSHPPDTYFGCTVLALGLLGLCLFAAVDEAVRALAPAGEDRAGFPVIVDRPGEQQ